MCDMCGSGQNEDTFTSAPGTPERAEELRQRTKERIMEHGHEVRYIYGGDGPTDVPFFYSVGRSVFERPEILITGGLEVRQGQMILNRIANLDRQGEIDLVEFANHGQPVRVDPFLCDFKFIWCDPAAAEMTGAQVMANDEYVASVQLIWPDAAGRWPDEEGYEYGPDAQPLYPAPEQKPQVLTVFRRCPECNADVLTMLGREGPLSCANHS